MVSRTSYVRAAAAARRTRQSVQKRGSPASQCRGYIAAILPVSWQHMSPDGKFDFSDNAREDSLRFDLGFF